MWSEDHDNIFKEVYRLFYKQFLQFPDWWKPFYINAGASGTVVSDVHLQERNGDLPQVSYFNKSLCPSEKRYSALKLKLMEV